MPKINIPYDRSDPKSIEEYGQRLVGSTLSRTKGIKDVPRSELQKIVSGRTRGSVGSVVEHYYYGIDPINDGTPDFPEAGVELKTTPIKKNKDGSVVSKERLVLGMIDYPSEEHKDFLTSSFYTKNEKLMILSYLHEEEKPIGDVRFLLGKLYDFNTLPKEDRRIIMEDWEKINAKIREHRAHELSEGDTLYLGACTKSATSLDRRTQGNGVTAKPRAFSYKQSYMTQLLRREMGQGADIERLISGDEVDEEKTFEQQVLERFSPYLGKTVSEIAQQLGVTLSKTKDEYAILARCMMGVKKKRIEEFEAAAITMKTIQLKADGTPKEAMSFPTFRYDEVIKEVWDGDEEEGETRAEFQKQIESRFLFVVYQCAERCDKEEERVLNKVFFWTMPQEDLEKVREIWEETRKLINEGRIVREVTKTAKNKNVRKTFFPKSTENGVAHVRPHGVDSLDICPLPVRDNVTGESVYTKHCFWLNIPYIKKVIERHSQ